MLTPSTSEHQRTRHVLLFLLASCLVHIFGLWLLYHIPLSGAPLDPAKSVTRDNARAIYTPVRMIDESSLPEKLQRANNLQKKPPKEEKKEEEKKKPPRFEDTLPYVSQDQLVREEQPDEARFSGKQAQRTEQETQRKAKPGASPTQRPVANLVRKGEKQGDDNPLKTRIEQPATPDDTEQPSRREEFESKSSDVILPGKRPESAPDPDLLVQNQKSSSTPQQGAEEGARVGDKQAPAKIFPSMSQQAKFSDELGDNGTFHYLKDVEEGDVTLLNQKRNRYWSFWDRMVRKVRREWNPKKEIRQRDPYGNVYGVGNFYTSVAVTLNADGSVHKLRVADSSDLDFLDDEAVRALLEAGPYPNPPEGLKDEDGLIHFRFGFNLEIVSGEVRLFRIKPEEPF